MRTAHSRQRARHCSFYVVRTHLEGEGRVLSCGLIGDPMKSSRRCVYPYFYIFSRNGSLHVEILAYRNDESYNYSCSFPSRNPWSRLYASASGSVLVRSVLSPQHTPKEVRGSTKKTAVREGARRGTCSATAAKHRKSSPPEKDGKQTRKTLDRLSR